MSVSATLPGQMAAARDRFRAFAFAWADLIVEVADGRITYAAGAAEPLLGCAAATLVGRDLASLVSPADRKLVEAVVEVIHRHGKAGETVIRLRGQGIVRPEAVVTGHCLGGGENCTLYLAFRARLSLGEPVRVPREASSGLYASDGFHALAAARLRDLAGQGVSPDVALVLVDGLDAVQAQLPADEREALEATLGAFVRASSLDGDTAAQVNLGKYAFLAPGGQDLGDLQRSINDLVADFAPGAAVDVAAANIPVGPAESISEEDLAKGLLFTLRRFESAESGLSLKMLASSMPRLVDQTVKQLQVFRHLVDKGQFDVALHPIIGATTGEIHHFEALCRFRALGKDVSPYKVITFAEETGLIHEFDLAMAAKVVEWLRAQPCNNQLYRLAVNVSGYSIGQAAYVDGLFALLARNPWTAGRLIFEITESSRMSDLDSANGFIQRLRGHGYEVCLDDFGAGAASFQYLSVLEVDVVKLDGSAVKNAQRAAKGRAFLSALTELCRRLSIHTVAEMVDTDDTLSFVRDCGCDYVQGWLFGKPSLDLADFRPFPNSGLFNHRRR